MNAVDTNVLAYAVDADGKDKRVKALELLQTLKPTETVIPWQVACELGSVLTKFTLDGRSTGDPADVLAALTDRFTVVLPNEGLVARGLRLARQHQVSYWDALLLAACVDAGVTRIYSEDMQGKPVIEGVSITNPFKSR
jgi:predicted nucleic acid-binding protein